MRREPGFTILELAVVVALLSLLAVLAVPAFNTVMKRAHLGEARVVMEGIAHAQLEYYRDHGKFRACAASPAAVPTRPDVFFDATRDGWSDIGFDVEGYVHFQYAVEVKKDAFTVVAVGDLDGDGESSRLTVDHTLKYVAERELE